MKEWLLDAFKSLPGWAKIAVFLLVLVLGVAYELQEIFQHVPFWPGMRIAVGLIILVFLLETMAWGKSLELAYELEKVTKERDASQKRFDDMNKVDTIVWLRKADCDRHFKPLAERKARFIAFCNFKGGVGKTTLALNVAAALALKGRRVLLIDLDWQATLSNLALPKAKLQEYRAKEFTSDILLRDEFDVKTIRQLMLSLDEAPTCQIILAREQLEEVEYQQQSRFFIDPTHEVRFLLQQGLHASEIANDFDYVFLDTPPRMTTASINAFACADYFLVPTSLSDADIRAVPKTLKTLKDLHNTVRANFLGVVVTAARLRSRKLVSYEKSQLGSLKQLIKGETSGQGHVFRSMVPDSPTIHKCALDQKTVAFFDVDIREYFEKVGREIEGRVPK